MKVVLRKTCSACPEQYDAYSNGKKVAYLRLRHGYFATECPDVYGAIVYQACTKGDGLFAEDEREEHLNAAKAAIVRWYKRNHKKELVT